MMKNAEREIKMGETIRRNNNVAEREVQSVRKDAKH